MKQDEKNGDGIFQHWKEKMEVKITALKNKEQKVLEWRTKIKQAVVVL